MLTWLCWWLAGCKGCVQLPPTDDDTQETQDTAHTAAPESAHSAILQGECAVLDAEPNDAFADAQPLPLETLACGHLDPVGDRDYYEFELEDAGWLSVELVAGDGSIMNPAVLVTPDGGGWAAGRNDDPESLDVHLRFPAPAGVYQAAISEQTFLGGERYGYELLVSEAKPPVDWTRSEVEPNDSTLLGEVLQSGDVVFGTTDGNGPLPDFDWYQVIVPAGKHTVSFSIVAFDEGSPADLTINLWSEALEALPEGCHEACAPNSPACVECAFEGGVAGLELDPFGAYASDGNELLWIQVSEAAGREGPANWYTLTVTVEGS